MAAVRGDTDIIWHLLQKGGDPDVRGIDKHQIIAAIRRDRTGSVRLFLDNGVDLVLLW